MTVISQLGVLYVYGPRSFEEFFSEIASSVAATGTTPPPAVAAEVIQPL